MFIFTPFVQQCILMHNPGNYIRKQPKNDAKNLCFNRNSFPMNRAGIRGLPYLDTCWEPHHTANPRSILASFLPSLHLLLLTVTPCSPALSGSRFMATITTLELSQCISSPTYSAGHRYFQVNGSLEELKLGQVSSVTPSSTTSQWRLDWELLFHSARVVGWLKLSGKRVESDGFLNTPGEFPVSLAGTQIKALIRL